jgi:prepilin-type N-terminal cleavage/methylation domain-containing protein
VTAHIRANSCVHRCRRTGFTLIELLLAVLLLAVLTSAAALSFSQPIRNARQQDAIAQLASLDATARQAAVSSGRIVSLVFDLSTGEIQRRDGGSRAPRFQSSLPAGFRVDRLRIGRHASSSGAMTVDFSSLGVSRTYAVHVQGPATDRWLLLSGLAGQMTIAPDDSKLEAIFADFAPAESASSRDDAD